jgi:putative DNA methylase
MAGMMVVTAHPVHAELRAASPKSAAKAPISLDAILVCRKRTDSTHQREPLDVTWRRADRLADSLESSGLSISFGDRFVVAAAQILIAESAQALTFEQIEQDLEATYQRIFGRAQVMPPGDG